MNERELKIVCRSLGDVTRIRLVAHLAGRQEVNVTELAAVLRLSQPLASWHLRILKRAGILTTRKDGRLVFCSLNRQRMQQLQSVLGDLIQNGRLAPAPVDSSSVPEASAVLAE